MNKLKIAIIAHLKFPIKEPYAGGLECFTHILAKKLIERGHEVVVFSAEGSDPTINPYIISKPTDALAKTYSSKQRMKRAIYHIEKKAYTEIMDLLQNSDFDIVHNNSLHPIPNKCNNLLPMPMVTTLHTPPFEPFASSLKAEQNLVTISKYMHKIWKHIKNTEIIYNGINLEEFQPDHNKNKQHYIMWSGRITKEKGTLYAIQAAKLLNFPLKIAGPIYNNKYFKTYIEPLLDDNIEYLGALPHSELSNFIAQAKVFLCTPAWDEPYGLVIAEALACGTPVAAFARGAIPEILDKTSGVLAIPNDVNSLSQAIIKAMELLPEDCRKRAENIADINKMIDKCENLYYKLIK